MFPLNFVVGAAVGAATTYVYKDEPAKQWLSETGNKLKEGANSFMASFKKKSEDTTEVAGKVVESTAEEVIEKAEDVKEAVAAKA
ncbi:YtxH domain-containing protein [Thiothrix nivea]|uniref:YtxH domain-containing protein n=1 Tax=Thiothrix nivea (strain ATCC 35100 / DSM 5205 / JP2) TaxID=870187 RepID=A0A656HMN5_THINJ|nr:YtxH domain-containing protein [Thiothrix nivea]EIJ36786.1 hypothetical protein Thini_4304 [Thiothrix nivea DSM 5205]